MKIYCPECGSASGYAGKKPNFCYSCGHSFSVASSEGEKQQEDLPEKIENIPNIAKLDVEIDTTDGYKKYKFGEVMGTLNPEALAESEDVFIHPEKRTNEQILQSIKKESKTLREKK